MNGDPRVAAFQAARQRVAAAQAPGRMQAVNRMRQAGRGLRRAQMRQVRRG